jgi:Tol biopolymer transport system component
VFFESILSKAAFSVSQNGDLVYQHGINRSGTKLAWWDRNGKKIGNIPREAQVYLQMRISPDGERVAISEPDGTGVRNDIWLHEIKRDAWTRFTFDAATDGYPIWSPDGKKIVFGSDRKKVFELFRRSSNGEAGEEILLTSRESKTPSDWSRDGRFIAYTVIYPPGNNYDIWILPMNATGQNSARKPFAFLNSEFNEMRAVFSPDGRWIAYQSNESGRDEIYIRPFPGPGGKWQISIAGGTRPRWRADGKELFFVGTDFRIMSAKVNTGVSTVEVDSLEPLFDIGYVATGSPIRDLYDVSLDGQRFLMESLGSNEMSMPMTLVINWPGELKKKQKRARD